MKTTPFIILHIPHSSKFVPEDGRESLLLSQEKLETELFRLYLFKREKIKTTDYNLW
jgi:hypothetical protein